VKVIQAITDLLERHWNQQGRRDSFQTLLTDPRTPLLDDAEGLAHIANVTAAMLDRLPGQSFRELAQELRQGTGLLPPPLWPSAVVFEEEPFSTVVLVAVPPLQALALITANLKEVDLWRMTFTTATLQLDRVPRSQEASTWAFHEPLQRDHLPFGATAERPDPLSLTLVEIPAGSFTMGSPPDEPERGDDEGPQHEVSLASFFMSHTPITQAQWREVAQWQERPGERWGRTLYPNPSRFMGEKGGLFPGEANTDQRPMGRVSWDDAMEFCRRLRQRTGRYYTLPSEAQWEYACRAGASTPFHFGLTLTPELANYAGNESYADGPKGEHRKQTTPVGMFPANAWGLHDMHGNVWEWCLDYWHGNYERAPIDGSASLNKQSKQSAPRVLRGGSWGMVPRFCRSAYRGHVQPDGYKYFVGFRVVCLPQGPSLNPQSLNPSSLAVS
jgi:formylglycine-generating enzyme required for sulfatase activity